MVPQVDSFVVMYNPEGDRVNRELLADTGTVVPVGPLDPDTTYEFQVCGKNIYFSFSPESGFQKKAEAEC